MRISDWSADVCSSDLRALVGAGFHEDFQLRVGEHDRAHVTAIANQARRLSKIPLLLQQRRTYRRLGGDQRRPRTDRKSGVEGKSVSVRVDIGGRMFIKKKTTREIRYT